MFTWGLGGEGKKKKKASIHAFFCSNSEMSVCELQFESVSWHDLYIGE